MCIDTPSIFFLLFVGLGRTLDEMTLANIKTHQVPPNVYSKLNNVYLFYTEKWLLETFSWQGIEAGETRVTVLVARNACLCSSGIVVHTCRIYQAPRDACGQQSGRICSLPASVSTRVRQKEPPPAVDGLMRIVPLEMPPLSIDHTHLSGSLQGPQSMVLCLASNSCLVVLSS